VTPVPSRIISNPARVFAYVSQFMPMQPVGGMKGLGLERDGKLVAGVLYEGFNGQNVWVHLAAEPGGRWMTREFLRYCFHYPFNEMKVKRLSGYVDASNDKARRLNEHLGYKPEAVLAGAGIDGGDVVIYVMWRDDCRYLED
jgi:RimJ/RimL family protein N-acetyltransferase